MNRTIRFFLLSLILLMVPHSEAQEVLPEEDAQEVLAAMADADMADEVTASWLNQKAVIANGGSWQGQWDTRVALSREGNADYFSGLKIQAARFSGRGRWRRDKTGTSMQAFTANLDLGSLNLQMGGVGVSTGYGLLVSNPGRSGGLAAGQALPSQKTRIKGWATTAEKRSILGFGVSWQGKGWVLTGARGRLGKSDDAMNLSTVCLEKQLGTIKIGVGLARMADQQGLSMSGHWHKGKVHRLGFEWVSWGKVEQQNKGVWLVSLKTALVMGGTLEAQWAASNGSAGPITGTRPAVLDAWGGAGWGVRISSPSIKSWRLKILVAESQGKDWIGPHQNQSRQFIDLMVRGRPRPDMQLSMRWHERIRTWQAWSVPYPWLPPSVAREDQRLGFTLDLKWKRGGQAWAYSLRSLGRQGATTNGRRTLASIQYRRNYAGGRSLLVSFQSAWGAAVDLVSAVSPMRGVLVPRHWGHWSSEILVGLEFPVLGVRLMTAISRREPAFGEDVQPESAVWAGARSRW
jgi:hypothetical protein